MVESVTQAVYLITLCPFLLVDMCTAYGIEVSMGSLDVSSTMPVVETAEGIDNPS